MFTTELQYAVIRYMFNELGDEAANVGLIALTDDPHEEPLCRFLQDPSVKSRIDARIKSEAIDRFAAYARDQIEEAKNEHSTGLFERLREFGMGTLRTSQVRSVLTNNFKAEFELLFNQWVAPQPRSVRPRTYSARDPLRSLKTEAYRALVRAFREGYGHPLSRQVFKRRYEVRGSSNHKSVFDFAMLQETTKQDREHLFQHVLLLPDAEESFTQAAGLCWRWSDIRKANHAHRDLTAILFERPEQQAGGVVECRRLLKKEEIEVAWLRELPAIARKLSHSLF